MKSHQHPSLSTPRTQPKGLGSHEPAPVPSQPHCPQPIVVAILPVAPVFLSSLLLLFLADG